MRADLAWHYGHHDLKVGADGIFSSVNEALQYTVTNRAQFDPDTKRRFNFTETGSDREQSAFIQDSFHARNWNVSAGIRFDHYHLATEATAWSPSLGSRAISPRLRCWSTPPTTGGPSAETAGAAEEQRRKVAKRSEDLGHHLTL